MLCHVDLAGKGLMSTCLHFTVMHAAYASIAQAEITTELSFLKGKQSQCLDHMGLTELIKSNNFQKQSYF